MKSPELNQIPLDSMQDFTAVSSLSHCLINIAYRQYYGNTAQKKCAAEAAK